jgi:osmotically-inducible protein OsmY
MKTYLNVTAVALLCLTAGSLLAKANEAAPWNANNSGVNSRDAGGDTLTPLDQSKGSKRDVEITRRIRNLVTSDKSLSTNAHNVKIISLNGVTTLRGPVNTAEERARVGKLARQVASEVHDELDVKQNN